MKHDVSPVRLQAVLAVFSVAMIMVTLLNWYSASREPLLVSTSLAVISLISLAILFFHGNTLIPRVLMSLSSFGVLLYLLWTGGEAGFGAVWLCVAPVAYLFFLGLTYGAITSFALALVLGVLFWSPLNRHVTHIYSDVFLLRFPIVYLSCMIFSWVQEYLRSVTHIRLLEAKAVLEDLAVRDALTGISNRRFFEKSFHLQWEAARRSGTDLSLLMIDVDNFKKFNDNYGHAAGDRALTALAGVIARTAGRANDVVARYGGEEFVVLLPFTNQDEGLIIADRIMENVAALQMPHDFTENRHRFLSVSIGIAALAECRPAGREDFFSMADNAMYEAKRAGGCMIVCAAGA